MILPITLTIAAAAALLNLWLAIRAGSVRMKTKTLHGDGGNALLGRRMRAHANFTEYVPLTLILLGLVELAGGAVGWLWAAGIALVVARILHGFGMDRDSVNPLRAIGIIGTVTVMIGLAVWALVLSYGVPAAPQPTMMG